MLSLFAPQAAAVMVAPSPLLGSTSALQTALLATSTFLSTSVFSISLLFATVVMPGIATLSDHAAYLRAFQVMDATIQRNQPLFMMTWVGSLLSTLSLLGVEIYSLLSQQQQGLGRHARRKTYTLLASCLLFLVGHVTTVTKNIPLNNQVYRLDISRASPTALTRLRQDFAGPWNMWNNVRTVLFGIASVVFTYVLSTQDSIST